MSKIHPNNIRWNYELERWEQCGADGVWMNYPEHNEEYKNTVRWNYELERWEQYEEGSWMNYPEHDDE